MDEEKRSSLNDSEIEMPQTMKKYSIETNLLGEEEDIMHFESKLKEKEV